MFLLNLLIVPIIFTTLFSKNTKLSYILVLLASLSVATFVFTQKNLYNILFIIAVFNLTPWACLNLHKLLEDCHRGIIQLPDFQRSWVWDEDRIKSLIASVRS